MIVVSKIFLCNVLAVLGCLYAFCARLSQNNVGEYAYNPSTVPFLAVFLKLAVSGCFLVVDLFRCSWELRYQGKCITFSVYVLLGFLYAIQNNLMFHTLKYVDVASFQVLGTLKIPCTAAILRLMGRTFTSHQSIAIILLVIGAISSQTSADASLSTFEFHIPPKGSFLMGLMIFTSSFGGVLNEVFLKDPRRGSIHWQNFQLYFAGLLFSFVQLSRDLELHGVHFGHMTEGFNVFAWLSVVSAAGIGLLVSVVLKFGDNIIHNFSAILSLYYATAFSWAFLDRHLTVEFVFGLAVTSFSLFLYLRPIVPLVPCNDEITPEIEIIPEIASNE